MTRPIAAAALLLAAGVLAAGPAKATEDLTPAALETGFVELCAKGMVATIAECACAFPKIMASTQEDDVAYYVTSWGDMPEKAAAITARHPNGWWKESRERRKAAQTKALADCKG